MFGDESILSQIYSFSRHNRPFASVLTACAMLADDVSDDVDADVAANVFDCVASDVINDMAADAAGDAKLTWRMTSFFQIVTNYI